MKVIDLFAGAGGFSTGARMAGCEVVWAANHWQAAVEIHASNHPEAQHICQDLHQADWTQVPDHDVLLASPCCQGHSRARGKEAGNPQHDASRSTAWAVVSAVEHHHPGAFVVENVPEFLRWSLFPAWSLALETLGYSMQPHIIDAADHGVPQHRERMFLVGVKGEAHDDWQEQQRNAEVGSMIYNGNTVSYMYSKARNYGNVLVECCNLIGGEGHLRDRIKALLEAQRDSAGDALLKRIDEAFESYERFGATCEFEGQPMIYASVLTEIAELRAAKGEGDANDATRYRWLRKQFWNTSNLFVVAGGKKSVLLGTDCPSGSRLDDAIDAAIAASAATKGEQR